MGETVSSNISWFSQFLRFTKISFQTTWWGGILYRTTNILPNITRIGRTLQQRRRWSLCQPSVCLCKGKSGGVIYFGGLLWFWSSLKWSPPKLKRLSPGLEESLGGDDNRIVCRQSFVWQFWCFIADMQRSKMQRHKLPLLIMIIVNSYKTIMLLRMTLV